MEAAAPTPGPYSPDTLKTRTGEEAGSGCPSHHNQDSWQRFCGSHKKASAKLNDSVPDRRRISLGAHETPLKTPPQGGE